MASEMSPDILYFTPEKFLFYSQLFFIIFVAYFLLNTLLFNTS